MSLVTARDGKHPVTVSDTLSCHPSHLTGDGDKLFGVTNSKVRDLMNPGHFALLLHYLKKGTYIFSSVCIFIRAICRTQSTYFTHPLAVVSEFPFTPANRRLFLALVRCADAIGVIAPRKNRSFGIALKQQPAAASVAAADTLFVEMC